jgi:Fic family protein
VPKGAAGPARPGTPDQSGEIDRAGLDEVLRRQLFAPPDSYLRSSHAGPVFTDLDLAGDPSLVAQVRRAEPRGVDRAIVRFRHRRSDLVYFDARLEGTNVTLPEVVTLLEGRPVRGKTVETAQQVLDFNAAAELATQIAARGPFQPTKQDLVVLHSALMRHDPVRQGRFRGDGPPGEDGPLVALGPGGWYHSAPNARMEAILVDGLDRIGLVSHAVERAVALAAFTTYHQFFLDGNKRVGRYAMNTMLMSAGFDAILVPASDQEAYEEALVDMYQTGQAKSYVDYLLELWLGSQ